MRIFHGGAPIPLPLLLFLSLSLSLCFPLLAFCGYAWAAAFIAFRTII